MKYIELREKHQKEFNSFPIRFAFSEEQFKQIMKEWGLDPVGDVKKIVALRGIGGFIQKKDYKDFVDMNERQRKELKESLLNDDFFTEACLEEFYNHEMAYNWQGHYDVLTTLGFKLKNQERENDEDYSNNPENFNLSEHQTTLYNLALIQYYKNIGDDI